MAESVRPITDHRLAFSMAEPAWTDERTNEWVFFRKKQRSEPLLPLVFYFALEHQTEEGIKLQIFRFFGDGFGVKEKKKAGTGELCPTVTSTHSFSIMNLNTTALPWKARPIKSDDIFIIYYLRRDFFTPTTTEAHIFSTKARCDVFVCLFFFFTYVLI
jgi:hypothetical protein